MNGREFLDSANRLAKGGNAADLRSATSRAYYAAFHAVRDHFSECDVIFPKSSPDAHVKMPQCLGNCNIPQAQSIGSRMLSLRGDRNGADYDMDDRRFEHEANARMRIQIAAEIIASVDSLHAEPNVVAILRPTARALGLAVRES